MHSKVPSDWLPSYIKAMQAVPSIFLMVGKFLDKPHIHFFHLVFEYLIFFSNFFPLSYPTIYLFFPFVKMLVSFPLGKYLVFHFFFFFFFSFLGNFFKNCFVFMDTHTQWERQRENKTIKTIAPLKFPKLDKRLWFCTQRNHQIWKIFNVIMRKNCLFSLLKIFCNYSNFFSMFFYL